jgi:hypothetical protein
VKLRRSTKYEQETLDGADAGFRHGIRAIWWREQRFGNTGPAAISAAAFNNRAAAVNTAALNNRSAAVSAAALNNRAAAVDAAFNAKHDAKYHPKHNDDFQHRECGSNHGSWLPEAVRRQLDARFR